MFSKTAVHALSAMATLAKLPPGQYAGAREIAAGIGSPPNYLSKLLKLLAERGLLQARKGKGGGFRLARSPQTISLFEVMEPIDHVSRWSGCFLGRRRCAANSPCPVHASWSKVRDQYFHFLNNTSLADLAR